MATQGSVNVQGSAAAGTPPNDNPVQLGITDGTNIRTVAGDTSGRLTVGGGVAEGGAIVGNPVRVGGTDGTNIRTIGVNTVNQVLTNTEGQKATYRSSIVALATVTGATDVFTLIGSGTKTIRVLRVGVGGTINTAAQYVDINLFKRAAADTAGASTAPAVVPLDSNDAAGSAVTAAYTANPTINSTSPGVVAAARYFAALTGTPALLSPQLEFTFGDKNGRGLVLRGVAQTLCVNLNAPGNAGVFDIWMEWTEE